MTEERVEKLNKLLDKKQNDITLILEDIEDPHNIAAVMRSCDAIGIMEIFVVNTTQKSSQRWSDKSSASANKWLPVHIFHDIESCIDVVRKKYPRIVSTYLNAAAHNMYAIDFTIPTAIIFGNEHRGVSQKAMELSDANMVIPQMGIIQSLNISVACAVTLYEAYRQKSNKKHYKSRKINDGEKQFLLDFWEVKNKNDF